jgi:nucleoside-diphosphate-sugar epimerase
VFASESLDAPYPSHARRIAYLPLDHQSPPNPANAYALSKTVGETMLHQYVSPHGLTCVALRYPWICPMDTFHKLREFKLDDDHRPSRITQGFSLLSSFDAAAAIVACLEAPLTGYHAFFPAISSVKPQQLREVIDRYYRDVPLRKPIEQLDSLVDPSAITRVTGWSPRDKM